MKKDYDLERLVKIPEVYKRDYEQYDDKFNGKSIKELLKGVKKENNIVEMKEYLLAFCQLISYESAELAGEACPLYPKTTWSVKKSKVVNKPEEVYQVFQELLNITKGFLRQFYFFEGDDINTTKNKIEILASKLIQYSEGRLAKKRDTLTEIGMKKLLHNVKANYGNEKPDIIFGVASGGIEIALIASIIFDQSEMDILRYSHRKGYGNSNYDDSKKDKEVKIPAGLMEVLPQKVEGKKVLILDDLTSSGKTLEKVSQKINEYFPLEIIFSASSYPGCFDNPYEDLKDPYLKKLSAPLSWRSEFPKTKNIM